jgi:hypothetical protein
VFTRLARRLLRALDRGVVAAQARRLRATRPGVRPAMRDGRWYAAEPTTARTTTEVTRELVSWLVARCEAAGVEYAVVPGREPGRPHLSVARRDRTRLQAHLTADDMLVLGRARGARVAVPVADLPPDASTPIEVFRPTSLPGGGLLTGPEEGCLLVEHDHADGWLHLAMDNLVAERVPESMATASTVEVLGDHWPTFAPLGERGYLDAIEFPIDVVYTWVDGSDPAWRASRDAHLADEGRLNEEAANASRWLDREELRYSLRSLSLYAPWVNHVWLVTAGHVPDWLDTAHPGLTVVTHEEIFEDPGLLPTFNSHAIEAHLHRIPGLAEHYVYLNDDVHLGRPVPPGRFFLSNGVPRFFPSRHQLDLGPARVDDPPVMSAAKNGRDLLADRFGRVVTQKLKHTPHAQRRGTVADLVATFPESVARTAAARFRSPHDVSVASSLVHHFGYLTERAVPASDLPYRYVNLTDDDFGEWLDRILTERHLEAFCINDTDGTPEQLRVRGARLQRFLEAYFPVASPYELSDARTDAE